MNRRKQRRLTRFGLDVRLIVVASVTAVLLAAIGGFLAWQNYAADRDRARDETLSVAQILGAEMETYLEDRIVLMAAIAQAPAVVSGDEAGMREYFLRVLRETPNIASINWADLEGDAAVRPLDPLDAPPVNVADRPYFQQVTSTEEPYVSEGFISRDLNVAALSISVPTYDEQGNLTGVLGAQITLDQLQRLATTVEFGARRSVQVVDRAGQVIVGTLGASFGPADAESVERAQIETSGVYEGSDAIGRDERLVAHADIPAGGWEVFVSESRSDALGASERALWLTLAGLAAVTVFGLGSAAWTGSRLHKAEREREVALLATEQALAKELAAREDAERALDTRNTFLSVASHEMKTPVTALKGYSQLLLRRATRNGDDEYVSGLRVLDQEATRLTTLINDLLDVSRIERGRLELDWATFDLNDAVRESVQQVLLTIERFRFELELGTEPVEVEADRMRLQQVVTNFLTNAHRYSPEGDNATVRVMTRDGIARVEVSDHGVGISLDDQAHTFELFYRSDAAGREKGMGIGLFVSKSIIDRHGGRIGVVSRLGQGSTFWFELPLSRAGAGADAP